MIREDVSSVEKKEEKKASNGTQKNYADRSVSE